MVREVSGSLLSLKRRQLVEENTMWAAFSEIRTLTSRIRVSRKKMSNGMVVVAK
jgi:hypothetical protein